MEAETKEEARPEPRGKCAHCKVNGIDMRCPKCGRWFCVACMGLCEKLYRYLCPECLKKEKANAG